MLAMVEEVPVLATRAGVPMLAMAEARNNPSKRIYYSASTKKVRAKKMTTILTLISWQHCAAIMIQIP